MTNFLPSDEQKMFDSIVHGLCSQGWSKSDAEAIARIEAKRLLTSSFIVEDINADSLKAFCPRPNPGDGKTRQLGRGTVTIRHEDGTEETIKGTWTEVFKP